MKAIPLLSAVVILLAGCTSPSPVQYELDQNLRPSVEIGPDERIAARMTNGSAAIVGHVLSDAGFGLPDARVTVFGANHGATTNGSGWFEILDVPPGKRLLRAEHSSYRPLESEVEVAAGKIHNLTITLVPPREGDAGDRPHTHDYWAGRTEVVAIDKDFEFYRAKPGVYGQISQSYTKAISLYQGDCVSRTGTTHSSYVSPFWFDDPAQLVWPGTSKIVLSIRWSPTDYLGGNTVGVVWRAPNMPGYVWSDPISSGGSYTISVDSSMWDNGHQMFSLWEFYLCVKGKGELTVLGSSIGRAFVGKYHVNLVIQKGHMLKVDPPHPKFWNEGLSISVLDEQRTFSCTTPSAGCLSTAVGGRSGYPSYFQFTPARIIPPGTSWLHVELWWNYTSPLQDRPLGISFSSADVPPQQKADETKFSVATGATKGAGYRIWNISIAPTQTDSFYQNRTNWKFMWGNEGEEASATYTHHCGCEVKMNLKVIANRKP